MITAGAISSEMTEAVRNDPSKPLKRIFNETILHVDAEEDIPEYHNIRSKLSRFRASLLPPIPENVDDVMLDGEWVNTWEGTQFLSHQDNDWGILVFATRQNYKNLRKCREIYIDGTFKTCPAPYMQFVTIHGNYHGRVLPFVMALLTGKMVGQYRELLSHVKNRVRQITGHRLRPERVISDFELAILLAVQAELRFSQVCGCYFHFCKSLWRRVQELGLAGTYARQRHLRRFIRKIMALGYLPLALVRHNFRALTNTNATTRLMQRYPALRDFIVYVRQNYLDGNYPPTMWNVFTRTNDNRTNNHVEGKTIL